MLTNQIQQMQRTIQTFFDTLADELNIYHFANDKKLDFLFLLQNNFTKFH